MAPCDGWGWVSLVVSAVEWSSLCNSLRWVRCGVVGWGEWGEGFSCNFACAYAIFMYLIGSCEICV